MPAVPARGRASTPAGAAADPPESTVVTHRPFSEMMPARGRGDGARNPGVRGNAPGTEHPGGGHPRGPARTVRRLQSPPGAAAGAQGTGTCSRPGATEAFSARKGF